MDFAAMEVGDELQMPHYDKWEGPNQSADELAFAYARANHPVQFEVRNKRDGDKCFDYRIYRIR